MSCLLFYYTLCVMLISIISFSFCFASFLVTRNKVTFLCSVIFFSYFFDVALIFQDDYLAFTTFQPYQIGSPLLSLITGVGILQSMWLAYCKILKIRHKILRYTPGIIFIALSLAMNFYISDPALREFWFYTVRAFFFFFILSVGACSLLFNKSYEERVRIFQYAQFQIGLWIFGACVVIENIIFLLILDPPDILNTPFPFLPERNFAENFLMVYAGICICKKHITSLALRFDKPLTGNCSAIDCQINQRLEYFANDHKLSSRESEVLYLLIKGYTGQEIANELVLAPSTIKVHTHNIYKKTGAKSKKDLLQSFWKHN